MAKLINGNGNRAIYAAQDADLIASLAGNVTCIANVGNKYAATIEDANTIGLADGVIITKEGRRIQLDAGDVDLFAIPTGSSGVTNYYIIGYKLVQQADSSQVAETFVQKMASSSATIAEGTLRGGDNEVYVSVYRVTQVDFTIDSVDGLLPELLDSSAAKAAIAEINGDLASASPKILVYGSLTSTYATFANNLLGALAGLSTLELARAVLVRVNTSTGTKEFYKISEFAEGYYEFGTQLVTSGKIYSRIYSFSISQALHTSWSYEVGTGTANSHTDDISSTAITATSYPLLVLI